MTSTKQKNQMLATLAKLSTPETREKATRPIIQEVAKNEPAKKIGRKSYTLEGVEYERLGVKVPADLKNEMLVAMRTTHKEYKTMDLFVAEAMRVFLALKR
jgi:hypothetical protein